LTSWSIENDNGGKKVMTRERRSKIIGWAKKKNLIANRGLKSRVHRHTLLEECVGRIVFPSFNLSIPLTYQSEHATTFSCYDVDLTFEWQMGWIRED
jgi:hypothetical protein